MTEHSQSCPDIEALRHYATEYCEGWCKDAPADANFDDCGGCRARLALRCTVDVAQAPWEGSPQWQFAQRLQAYLDDAPADGRHSDAAGGNAYDLIEEAIGWMTPVSSTEGK